MDVNLANALMVATERAVRPGRIEKPMVGLGRKIATDANELFYSWGFFLPGQDFWDQEDAAVIENIGRDQNIAFWVIITAARRGVYLDSAEGRFLGAWAFYQEVSSLFESTSGEEKAMFEKTKQKMEVSLGQYGLDRLSLKNGRVFPLDLVRDLQAAQSVDFPLDRLTGIEVSMLYLIVLGKSDMQIAEELGLARQTVRNKLSELYPKLGVRDRTGVAIRVMGHVVQGAG